MRVLVGEGGKKGRVGGGLPEMEDWEALPKGHSFLHKQPDLSLLTRKAKPP